MGPRRKFVIDTDAGIDDAQAILMALKDEDVDIVAITTCHGNVDVDQVAKNVVRVLQVVKRSEIPIYNGCNTALLGEREDSTHYHGMDGLGDSPDENPPDVSSVQSEHAVTKLIELSKQHQDLTLICLAPLTNIAMAVRLDPEFSGRLAHCYVMGGAYSAKGNHSATAEFNFYADPEAADIVMKEMTCPVTLGPWEACIENSFSWDWYDKFVGGETELCKLMKRLETKTLQKYYAKEGSDYLTADQLLMAVALDEDIATKTEQGICTVEKFGPVTRGQLCVDWSFSHFKHKKKINIVKKIDKQKYSDLLMAALR